jgi:hypothetical protein
MARIAALRAMNHGKEGVFRTDRKKNALGQTKAEARRIGNRITSERMLVASRFDAVACYLIYGLIKPTFLSAWLFIKKTRTSRY